MALDYELNGKKVMSVWEKYDFCISIENSVMEL